MADTTPASPTRIGARGLGEDAATIFGSDTHIHPFMHDARHLPGFSCH